MRVNIARMNSTNNNDAIAQAYAYFQHGQLEAAHNILQPLALQVSADFNLLHLAGAVAAGLQMYGQAIELFRRALVLKPDDLSAGYKLGRALYDADRREEALSSYLQLISAGARHADLYLAAALLLQESGRDEEALQTVEHAVRLSPQHADAWHRHAVLLARLSRPGDALHSVQQAVMLAPDRPACRFDLALILFSLHRNDEALIEVDRVLTTEPSFTDAWACRAAVLGRLRRYDESMAASEKALSLRPGDPDATVNLALTQLTLGRFDSAWLLYETRWQGELANPYRHADIPRWPGLQDAAGKTVLLWAEQGLGDTIQFCRYALRVAALGANVVLEVHASLKTLSQTLSMVSKQSIVVKAIGETLPEVDYQIPLMSLPLVFDTRVETIPAPQAYLCTDKEKGRRWQQFFSGKERLDRGRRRVGIVCSGNPGNHNDRRRSVPLKLFAPVLDADGVEFFLLQPEIRQSDANWLQTVCSLHWPGREMRGFDDTAALIVNLDLVIAVDTAAAHLAGALGVPVWILLSHAADWRWFLNRSDSPWYDSARLFRQPVAGNWEAVLETVRTELIAFLQEVA